MTPITRHPLTRTTIVLVSVLAAIALTACGSSSSSTTKTDTTSTAASTPGAGSAQQRTAIQACLKKYGVALPSRPPRSTSTASRTGTTPRTGGLFAGGANGTFTSNPKIRADLRKCGISAGQRPAATSQVKNPAYQRAVNDYVACVRKNGYNLPKPNFTGKGPVFNASQTNRNDPKFKAASAKCQQLLNSGQPHTTTSG
jgi:ABC-type Fe3+-hydroxamate transport system substrate-binding protein